MRRIAYGSIALAACLAAGAPKAIAEDLKLVGSFGWVGIGKVYPLEQGHLFWVGEFTGTFFNDKGKGSPFDRAGVKCPGYQDIDFNKKHGVAAGSCIMNDLNGDQAYLSWKCEGDAVSFSCKGTNQYTGGTGKYKGVSGAGTFSGTTVNWKDGTATGFSIFNRD